MGDNNHVYLDDNKWQLFNWKDVNQNNPNVTSMFNGYGIWIDINFDDKTIQKRDARIKNGDQDSWLPLSFAEAKYVASLIDN